MDVRVTLEDIDEENWREVAMLTTETDHIPKTCEKYVAGNALSICQAFFEDTWTVRVAYCGHRPVGFVMYGYCEEYDFYELCRLMVDIRHQGRGFGNIILRLAIEEILEIEDCEELCIRMHPENERAKHLYEKVGFKDSGRMAGNEAIYVLSLADYREEE